MLPYNQLDAKLDLETEATEESTGYVPKGYKIHSEFNIECLGCGKDCVHIVIADKSPKYPDQSIQILCNRCGQLSFKKHVGNVNMFFDAVGNYKITDTQFLNGNFHLIEVK